MVSSDNAPAGLPRRDRIVILSALAGVTALAWLYLVIMAARMPEMNPAMMMGVRPWSALDFWMMFLMWAVMMVGMMVPSAAPMILLFALVARKAGEKGHAMASVPVFVAGYILAWSAFSLAATILQWGLERLALLSPMMTSASPFLGAGLLIAAGAYQLTPLKDTCLRHCRAPADFLSRHWRPGAAGAVRLGAIHGAFCIGCCWVLMGLLFLGGVMNLLWIAAIAIFVLIEKLAPAGRQAGRISGFGLIAAGLLMAMAL